MPQEPERYEGIVEDRTVFDRVFDRVERVLLIVVLLWVGLIIGLLLVSPLLPPLSMEHEERCPVYSDLPFMEPLCVAAGKVALIIWPPPASPNPEASTVGPAWSTSEMNSAKSMADIG